MRRAGAIGAAVLLWALLLPAPPATADWSVTIQGPVTITGPGAGPIVIQTPVPPLPLPPPPPVIAPPPPPAPPVDNSPFPFPAQCPGPSGDPAARYYLIVAGGQLYAGRSDFGNPLPYSHTCVGLMAPGTRNYDGSADVSGMLLWAPRTTPPSLLRCALLNGRHCP